MPLGGVDPIPFSRFAAALQAGNLAFIQSHRAQLTLSLTDEADICRLVAEQDPARLESESVTWLKRFAASARGEPRSDYVLIVEVFERMVLDPEVAAGQLRALCAARGLDR